MFVKSNLSHPLLNLRPNFPVIDDRLLFFKISEKISEFGVNLKSSGLKFPHFHTIWSCWETRTWYEHNGKNSDVRISREKHWRESIKARALHVKYAHTPSGRPDWANFRLLGDCLLWPVLLKMTKFWATLFHGKFMYIHTYWFRQKMEWATFWAIFPQNSSGHPAQFWRNACAHMNHAIRFSANCILLVITSENFLGTNDFEKRKTSYRSFCQSTTGLPDGLFSNQKSQFG
jgi:hypothetical protein